MAKKGKAKFRVGGYDIGTIFIASITKNMQERLLRGIIGDGTIISGAIKLGIALFAPKLIGRGHIQNAICLGFGIDGVDDILTGFLGGGGNGGGAQVL